MAGNGKQLHVAMFPWLAFGHIIPFLDLSKFIAGKGHRISFLSTSRNIHRLPPLPPHLSPLINLVKLTLPKVNELPSNAEATSDVRTDQIHYLKKAFDGLQPELTQFLEIESPDWIIYDFAPFWLPSIAFRLGISKAFFSIINAWFLVFLGRSSEDMINGSDERKSVEDFLVPPKWITFPTKVCYKRHEVHWMLGSSSINASGVTDLYRAGKILHESDVIFVRHCYELEPQWVGLLEKLHGTPVVPVGLMPPEIQGNSDGDEKNEEWVAVKNWLEGQPKGGVVYVALGSEVTLSKAEIGELALGLELSGLPFFWALRKPAGSIDLDPYELPDGFLKQTKDRALVWMSWAPQLQILKHNSVGGFLTHCGWSSVVEGLMCGHPLIMLPFLVDQGLNARLLVDKGVGIEVPRNEQDGSFSRDLVAKSLSSVMIEDQGKLYKANAKEMSVMISDRQLHKKYIHDFIDYLEKKRYSFAVDCL